jgi:hypothetical protein
LKTANKDYKLFKKIKDENFDVDQLHHYNLNLLVGNRDLQVAVIDNRDNRCLVAEDFILASIDSYSELVSVFEHIFDNHHLLKAGFWSSVKIGLKSNKFSLVPSNLFDPDKTFDYLKFNCKVSKEYDELMYFKHIKSDAVNSFAVNKRLYNWIELLYPEKKVGYIHQSSALIEGVLAQLKNYPKDSIFVYVDRFKLHIITSKDNKLEYYNQFNIKKFSDYIKYIMTVMKGLNRNQMTTNVVLWGYIGRQSKHYNEFAKYIKNISFGDRPKFLEFGYLFDELQDHHYFDLYNVHLCE